MIQMLLLPNWVEDALKAANKPMSNALNALALADTLSNEDVAIYIDCNKRGVWELYRPIADSLIQTNYLSTLNAESGSAAEAKGNRIREQYYTYQASTEKCPLYNVLTAMPQQPTELGQTIAKGSVVDDYTFDAVMCDNVLFIKPKLVVDGVPKLQQQIEAYGKLIAILAIHNPLEVIAKSSIFKHYVMLLQTANV